jgi:serine/threonine-protein kinase
MLAGERAFPGETSPDVIAKVLERQPAFEKLPADVAPTLRRLLRRCLEKDPRRRLRDIGDARLDLAVSSSQETPPETLTVAPAHMNPHRAARTLALLGAVAAIAIAAVLVSPFGSLPTATVSFAPAVPARFYIEAPGLLGDGVLVHALSPDGTTLVYAAEEAGISRLYRQRLDELERQAITGTEGANQPFFSPDGRWVGFYADGQLKKVALTGGDPVVICERCPPHAGATWGRDGTILRGGIPPAPLMQIASEGGMPTPLSQLDEGETNQWAPHFMPDGRAVLFVGNLLGSEENRRKIVVERVDTHERRALFDGITPRFLPTGHIAYMRKNSDALWVVPFDAERLEVTGEAVPVLTGVRVTASNSAHFVVAGDGTLAYVPGTVHGRQARLVWRNPMARVEPLLAQPQGFPRSPRLSSDGTRLAATVSPPGETAWNDIWIYDVGGSGLPVKLTVWGGSNLFPVWTPDGSKIAFVHAPWGISTLADLPNREVGLFWAPADGSAQGPELLVADGVPQAWSPDGAELVIAKGRETSNRDLWVVSVADRSERPLIATRYNEDEAALSPDGAWLAYVSDQTGRAEVYVQRYGGGSPTRVSRDAGHEPRWARDGSALYYQSGRRIMLARFTSTETGLGVGTPEVLFEGGLMPYGTLYSERTFDVAPDGRLIVTELGETEPERIVIVQQWAQQLTRDDAR